MTLENYRTLGRSGLVVSPMTLGTMTFGAQGWGSSESVSQQIFNAYIESGGNSIDTADVYASGESERRVGQFIKERGLRDQLVLATKAGFPLTQGNPNAGGNGAKHINAALRQSLQRLQTDYIDLFWVHVWDAVTPADELLATLVDRVRAGDIRYFGLSNFPAWYVTQMAQLARQHGVAGPIALQLEYSLTERSIENEHIPMAREFGLAVMPWSPLDGGFLTGKYHRETARDTSPEPPTLPSATDNKDQPANNRLDGANPFGNSKFTKRNWAILDTVRAVAEEQEVSMARVALAWASGRPGIQSTLIGASRVAQLQDNLAALDVRLTPDQTTRLNDAGSPSGQYPYFIFEPMVNRMVFGGTQVDGWQR